MRNLSKLSGRDPGHSSLAMTLGLVEWGSSWALFHGPDSWRFVHWLGSWA
jgi:hypothetical protein